MNDCGAKHPRFLILRGGALGDFIVTLPVLAALRAKWPEAYMELVGYPRNAELARAGGLVDRVESLDSAGIARLFSLKPAIPEAQADHLRSFNLVVNLLYDPGDTVRENMTAIGVRRVLSIDPRPSGGHAADHLFRVLEPIAIYADSPVVPSLSLPCAGCGATDFSNTVVIHSGSGSPGKNWPFDRFLELARMVADRGFGAPVFLFGEADMENRRLFEETGDPWPVLDGLTVLEVAGRLSRCRAYVGNDSGISHLAAALGIPVVVLFGPSNPAVWGPRGLRTRIVRAGGPTTAGLAAITADAAFGALESLLRRGSCQ
jgi:ADP-heptose:LPS heptosyltransferase